MRKHKFKNQVTIERIILSTTMTQEELNELSKNMARAEDGIKIEQHGTDYKLHKIHPPTVIDPEDVKLLVQFELTRL